MPQITKSHRTATPLLDISVISHGTLVSIDLQQSRRFYEEVLGLDVIQVSPVSLLIRKGTDHSYAVVETGEPSTMALLDHNGLNLSTRDDVDTAFAALTAAKAEYGIKRLTKVMDQHGAYSFYVQDVDGNWWEIMSGNEHGYAFGFDEGRDISDRFDLDPEDMDYVLEDETAERLFPKS